MVHRPPAPVAGGVERHTMHLAHHDSWRRPPVTDNVAAIVCRGVRKRFGSVAALDGLDLTVAPGTVVGYLGTNGAGKSTTIRILLDLARPDAGEVRVLGADPRTAGPSQRRRIGYVPGELRLDDRLRVDETLQSWARIRGGVDDVYLGHLCERLRLDPTRPTRNLSSGNRRKVGLVGAFMARPDLLILDEPTAGVDPLVQAEVLDLIAEVRDDGRTVFLSSHVLSDVQRIADDVIVIRAGKVVANGDLEVLRRAARQQFAIWFVDEVPSDELRQVSGVRSLEVRGHEARGVLEGDPNHLLQVLATHRVAHVVMPEPDLERTFLGYYENDDR
jgi:ABC-2 type transport system ATP-binding protein